MPHFDELIERLGKAAYMTTLDLCKGYWQVTLYPFCKTYNILLFDPTLGYINIQLCPLVYMEHQPHYKK